MRCQTHERHGFRFLPSHIIIIMLHHPSLEEPVTCCNHLKGERGALSARCDAAGSCSPRTVSMSDSDLMITRPTVQELAATPQISCSSIAPAPHHLLHTANHVNMNVRRGESDPLRSRQPPFIFPSSDHEPDFAVTGPWSPRSYACSFCGREFNSAQALGGHMNIHRRDRARLRSSTSLSSLPHPSDLPPAPQIHTPKSSLSALYLPFDAACRDHPASIIATTYQPPTIISATPTSYKLLPMRSAADPALLAAMAAPPHHDDNSAAPCFSAPVSDLVSFRFGSARSSSATSVSKINQNGAYSLFPNIDPHGSSLLIRPMLENSSFKPAAEARNVCPGQASSRRAQFRQLDSCSGAKGAGAQQGIQLGQAKGSNKRARGDNLNAVMISSEDKSTVQSCDEESCTSVSSTRNSNSLQTAAATPRSCARPSHDVHNDMKELNCLDLELRLGQSSPAPAADNN